MKKIPWHAIWRQVMRAPAFAAEHAFPFTLLLISIAGALSLLLFTMYGSRQTKQVEQGTSLYDVKEELFSDTMGELEKRKATFEGIGTEPSKDIFNPD